MEIAKLVGILIVAAMITYTLIKVYKSFDEETKRLTR